MTIRKSLAIIIFTLVCASLLHPQSLTELAKKEKERRAKLKGKKIKVVTNADLKNLKIQSAISVRLTKTPETGSSQTASSPEQPPTSTSPQVKKQTDKEQSQKNEILEEKWQQAQGKLQSLSLKMNALWKEFNNPNSTVPKDRLKQEIALTYLQFQEAQQEADQLQQEINKTENKKPK